jgi:hypothetical protein
MDDDLITAAIAAQNAERDRLRSEVAWLTKAVDDAFEKGYAQAVREIAAHFAKAGDHGIVHVINSIWEIKRDHSS